MKRLRFVVKAKLKTNFTDTTISFLRAIQTVKPHQVPYTAGNGFQVVNGNNLLTEGINNQIGYLNISINGDQTITGSGNLNLLVTRYPSSTQATEVRALNIDGSSFNLNFLYNSRPIIRDMEIEVDNRTDRVVTLADFTGHWSDFDGDNIGFITIYNSDNNLLFNNVVYVSGTPISATDISLGRLKYTPDDVDNQYNDDYDYTITDTQGNVSE